MTCLSLLLGSSLREVPCFLSRAWNCWGRLGVAGIGVAEFAVSATSSPNSAATSLSSSIFAAVEPPGAFRSLPQRQQPSPHSTPGRLPHHPFRGLLSIHS